MIQQTSDRSQLLPERSGGSAATDDVRTVLRYPDPAGVDQVQQSIAFWAHREHSSAEDNDPRRPTVRRAFVAIDVARESASGIIVRRLGGLFVRGEAL